jgi:hypothetical protein
MNWYKKTYVCGLCDSLVEISTRSQEIKDRNCFECNGQLILLSVADATITSTTTTKEEPMIENALPELTAKIADLELKLQNADYWKSENGRIGSQLINLINNAYENDAEASEILESICEIIDYNPVKTVQFEGVIHFSGSIDIPMNEVADFDLTSALEDVYVDINNGNVVIDNYELYSVEEPY